MNFALSEEQQAILDGLEGLLQQPVEGATDPLSPPYSEALEQRLARAERVQRETVESLERLRKAVRGVDSEMARRADVKKLKNVLDQLEVVEIAEGPPQPAVDG